MALPDWFWGGAGDWRGVESQLGIISYPSVSPEPGCLGRATSDGREFAVCGGGCLGGAVGHGGTWLTALGASGHIENLLYTSYTFTGKLDL
jgi:hypothetical protein